MTLTQTGQASLNQFQKGLDRQVLYAKKPRGSNSSRHASRDGLRVLCWNIERGYEPDVVAEYVAQLDPDVACLQEVDWGNARTEYLDVLDYLANKTGLQGIFGIEFFELETPYRTAELAGGGVHGNAILSRFDFSDSYRIELPVIFDWEAPPSSEKSVALLQKRLGSRFALCAGIECCGSRFTFCSAHLENIGGDLDGRVVQLQSLVSQVDERTAHTVHVIAGDFNTLGSWLTQLAHITQSPRTKPWYMSECSWWEKRILPGTGYSHTSGCSEWTFRAFGFYRQKLDWILVSKPLNILRHGVGDFHSSDHRPIWVDIQT